MRARRLPGGVRAPTSSLSAPSSSSSAASPVRLHALRWTGYMLDIQPPAPGRRCSRPGGAVPVQHGYQAGHAGVCSTLHRNHHVAPRSATTLASEWCTCEVQAAHASPSLLEPARTTYCNLLMGTVALFRMGKRVPVVKHHFCQHGAPRCGHGRGPAVFRALRRPRTAAPRPVRAPGESAQPSWSALGPWRCFYGAYRA